jgi:hypothetical protein
LTETAGSARTLKRPFFVRDLDAERYLDIFFIAAIATIILVRAALAATGWPQLGGGTIHFAHLLWGGLGMLLGIVILVSVQGRVWRELGALAAGIGWGLFIDELGKFITADNDYFFQPSMALIYLTFVILYFVFRALTRVVHVSPQTALVNAFDEAKEAVLRDMDESERARALALLDASDPDDPVVAALRHMVESAPASGEKAVSVRIRERLAGTYRRVTRQRWFKTVVIGFFVVAALVAFVYPFLGGAELTDMTFGETGEFVSAVLMGLLVLVGIVSWRRSRLAAFRWFERAALVNIFIGQFFAFYEQQMEAVFGLFIMLVTLGILRYMIGEEQVADAPSRR